MEIKIPKEVRQHKETIFFGLSVRQFICAVLAVGTAVGVYFLLKTITGPETASWACIVAAVPLAVTGFFQYNGMTFEQFVWAYLKSHFKRVDIDLSKSFGKLDSGAKPLDNHERRRIFHDFFRPSEERDFQFDLSAAMRQGHHFKDAIAPDGMQFKADHFELGGKVGRVLFLREYASYIKDRMITDLSDFSRNLMLSIDILPIPTNEAVKEMQARILGVESDITRWQQKQNANNNFTATVPYELEQLRAENKEFLDDLSTRDQCMIFANVTLVHMADTLEQLDADTETLQAIGNESLCQFSVLRYQQEDGLNTALPYGLRRVKTTRTLTTESAAVLMPFRVREIQDAGGIYYGVNAVSKNLLICNRKRLLNPHGFILGVSGSGKSFSMKEAITFIALSTSDDIIIIDAEREYGDLTRALGGAVIESSPNSPHHINPLEIARSYGTGENPVAMKSELLMGICEQQMGAGQLGAFHKSNIDRCTASVYHELVAIGGKSRQPILSDWHNELKRQPESGSAETQAIGTVNMAYNSRLELLQAGDMTPSPWTDRPRIGRRYWPCLQSKQPELM